MSRSTCPVHIKTDQLHCLSQVLVLVEEEEEEDTQWRENRLEGTGPSEQVGGQSFLSLLLNVITKLS